MLGTDEATARALVCAAVRETFEESGVLLAGSPPTRSWRTPPGTTGRRTGWPWRHADAVRSPTSSTDAGSCCAPTCCGAWAGWLTPVFEPRRYRTWFFVAALPRVSAPATVGGVVDR